jgi:hypothetical protein
MKRAMKIQMKNPIVLSVLVLAMSSMKATSYGQAVPAGVATISPSAASSPLGLPSLDGIVHYALSASEIVQLGYYGSGQVTSSAALSGDVAYTAKSTVRPFSLLFAGGVILPNQTGQGVSTYENIAVSQGYITKRWAFNVSDSFSFLPESPTTGLSGIPGVGDLGVVPISGPVEGPAGGILSVSGNRFANSVSGSVEREITPSTTISGSGSWSVLHFLTDTNVEQGGGLDTDQTSGTVSVNRRLDQRSSVSLNAVYSVYNYTGEGAGPLEPNFQTKGLNVSYQRVLSRTLSMNASIGPQWVSSSNSTLIPSSVDVAGSAGLVYSRRYTTASVGYMRGVNGGSGVITGGLSDSIFATAGRTYGRNWAASLNASYTHTSGLTELFLAGSPVAVNEIYNTVFGGFQVTRRISTNFSGYVTYTAQNQSASYASAAQNALDGTSQTFGIGITFSPRSTRLGQF